MAFYTNWITPNATAGNSASTVNSSNAGVASSAMSSLSPIYELINMNTANNNAWSARQAQISRDWQVQQIKAQQEFNSNEARLNRQWQEKMSNTAIQRQVKDLRSAGLNPVLAALGGSGASTTSGATASASAPSGAQAQTDTSANAALTGVLGSLVSSFASMENSRVSAQANLAVAEKYNQMSKYVAELQANTQLTTANINALTSRYVASLHLEGTKYASDNSRIASIVSAQLHAAATRYSADVNSWTQQQVAHINGKINKELKQMGIDAQFNLKKWFPGSLFNVPGSFSQHVGDLWDSVSPAFSDLLSEKTALGTFIRSLFGAYSK